LTNEHGYDLTVPYILPHISGDATVAQISTTCSMDLSCVRATLRVLGSFGVIKFKDVWDKRNRYEIDRYAEGKLRDVPQWMTVDVATNPHLLFDYFNVYKSLDRTKGVRQIYEEFWCDKYEFSEYRKIVEGGVLAGVLNRIHSYPVAIPGDITRDVMADTAREAISDAMNGRKSDDQISEIFGMPFDECMGMVERAGWIVRNVYV
jgi:hypothetical protein